MENYTTSMIVDEETEVMKSKEGHVPINPFASSREPLPYDPMLGWYTAATLSGLLILFLACVGLEKVKDKILMTFEKDHQGGNNVRRGERASLAGGGCDGSQQRLGRGSNEDPKCLAESDALLGRNCVDHNYVYLTLDRPNHVDANQSGPAAAGSLTPRGLPPAGCPTTRSPTVGREGEGVEPLPSTASPSSAETAPTTAEGVGREEGTRTTQQLPSSSSFGAVQTHNVKIEIVEVHSESPVHEMAAIDERDVHESVV